MANDLAVMSRAPSRILESLAVVLNRLPGVFSTAQWGGRAYKLPGPGGSLKKPKLLAFVSLSRDGASVVLTFKLPKPRAVETIGRHSWIIKESFGSLGAAGWVQAKLTQQRQINVLTGLLAESRALHPEPHAETAVRAEDDAGGAKVGSSAVARRIARVMQQELPEGWSPPHAEAFVDAVPTKQRSQQRLAAGAALRPKPSRNRR